jgi:hypothetical protein
MSHLLYSKRVFWNGRKGGISIGGLYRNVTAPPVFRCIDEIDYAPEVGCAQVRPEDGQMREMWPVEIQAAEAYLNSVQFGGPVFALRDLSIDGS